LIHWWNFQVLFPGSFSWPSFGLWVKEESKTWD
jgi:hypothetical protein